MRTNDELMQLARDVFEGRVFTSAHFKSVEDMRELTSMVFTPLLYFSKEQMDKMKKDMGNNYFFYEYYDKASAGKADGYPIFRTMNYLTKAEYPVFLGFHALIEKEAEMKKNETKSN